MLLAVAAVKEWLSRRILSAGGEIGSAAPRADAWHHRSDAISSGAAATATPGAADTEKCRIRKGGTNRFVELHVRVVPGITVFEGHEIGHRVKERILAEDPLVRDVLVHIEPAG